MNRHRLQRVAFAKDELEVIREEEQQAYDNLPESIQESAAGEKMQEWIDALDDAIVALDAVSP